MDLINSIDSGLVLVKLSETTMDYCFDIVLENEDYTMGKVLEYILYEKYFIENKKMSFCGFKKFHPHDTDSIIRVAFEDVTDKVMVAQYLREACVIAADVFSRIYKMF